MSQLGAYNLKAKPDPIRNSLSDATQPLGSDLRLLRDLLIISSQLLSKKGGGEPEMQLTRKALYNLLRMNWLQEPTLSLESWQVEDYRSWETQVLFRELQDLGIVLDKRKFLLYAENCDTPEDLAEVFHEEDGDVQSEDRAYLLLFELWRRLIPENRPISIFCDDLDHMILDYDAESDGNDEALQDQLANLQDILDESVDEGQDPLAVFDSVRVHCAHDLESFLYDYIAEQIDAQNLIYASELLDGFYPYLEDHRWFDLLYARILANTDIERANMKIQEILADDEVSPTIDLHLEILDFLSQSGDRELFIALVQNTLPLIETEEDFLDVLRLCGQYYGCLDVVEKEQAVEKLVAARMESASREPFRSSDHAAKALLGILTS